MAILLELLFNFVTRKKPFILKSLSFLGTCCTGSFLVIYILVLEKSSNFRVLRWVALSDGNIQFF